MHQINTKWSKLLLEDGNKIELLIFEIAQSKKIVEEIMN